MKHGQELVWGFHAVDALLRKSPQSIEELVVDKRRSDKRLQALCDFAQRQGIRPESTSVDRLNELSNGAKHQGVVARYRNRQTNQHTSISALLQSLTETPFLLILDGVQDPHNLGACLRSAEAAGVHGVILPKDRACGLTPVVHKVSAGATQTMPIFQVANLAREMEKLQQQGLWMVGSTEEGEQEHFSADLSGPLALVLGAEGQGLRRLTRDRCDRLVRIPMCGQVQSLNVSVATGVLLFEALRQRS